MLSKQQILEDSVFSKEDDMLTLTTNHTLLLRMGAYLSVPYKDVVSNPPSEEWIKEKLVKRMHGYLYKDILDKLTHVNYLLKTMPTYPHSKQDEALEIMTGLIEEVKG